jgi:hypothetical protein
VVLSTKHKGLTGVLKILGYFINFRKPREILKTDKTSTRFERLYEAEVIVSSLFDGFKSFIFYSGVLTIDIDTLIGRKTVSIVVL